MHKVNAQINFLLISFSCLVKLIYQTCPRNTSTDIIGNDTVIFAGDGRKGRTTLCSHNRRRITGIPETWRPRRQSPRHPLPRRDQKTAWRGRI